MEINKFYKLPFIPKQVFEVWVSPESTVTPVTKIEVVPKVEGYIKLFVESSEGTSVMEGCFKEIIPNEKLIYTWEWDKNGEQTQVTVIFSEKDEQTKIEINHKGFTEQGSFDIHDAGWDSYINGITKILATQQS